MARKKKKKQETPKDRYGNTLKTYAETLAEEKVSKDKSGNKLQTYSEYSGNNSATKEERSNALNSFLNNLYNHIHTL